MTTGARQDGASRDSRSRRNEPYTLNGRVGGDEAWVLAWWKDQREARSQRSNEEAETVHIYKTHVKPSSPLAVGKHARILAMPRSTPTTPGTNLHDYQAYDPHVAGVVVGMMVEAGGWMTVTIQNLCNGNAVQQVELEIVYVPDEMVQGEEPLRAGASQDGAPRSCRWSASRTSAYAGLARMEDGALRAGKESRRNLRSDAEMGCGGHGRDNTEERKASDGRHG
ncbi:hypothetical protein C8T65DRAFT_697230 [Cerioporus squamosus]|nr:hypothetical protein C8T65DRAFT_697230 [Cerioporus squamosus]